MAVKRPNSKRNLDMALRRMGKTDEDYIRRRTTVANAIIASLMPDGALKGGSAMKIRFGESNTRASTDLDATRASELDTFIRALEDALMQGWGGFFFANAAILGTVCGTNPLRTRRTYGLQAGNTVTEI